MIEINLLPQGLKRKKPTIKLDLASLPILRIGIIFAVSLLVIYILMILGTQVVKFNLVQLNNKWQSMSEQKKELDAIKKEIADLDEDIQIISRLEIEKGVWSRRLNAISDSLTVGIWLRELLVQEVVSTEKVKTQDQQAEGATRERPKKRTKKYLNISGTALMVGTDGMANVGKLMNSLKSNKDFFENFQDMQLGSIQRRLIKGVEVMDFTIVCLFKER